MRAPAGQPAATQHPTLRVKPAAPRRPPVRAVVFRGMTRGRAGPRAREVPRHRVVRQEIQGHLPGLSLMEPLR